MKNIELKYSLLAPLCVIASAGSGMANTLSANVVDYNAAQVGLAGSISVPTNLATYAVTSSPLPVATQLTFTLPAGFTFGSAPSLSTTGTSTFTLINGGFGSQSATFLVQTATLAAGQSVSLNGFSVQEASALTTPIAVANALPIGVQALGIDAVPLTKGAFASEPGIKAVFVGAIQFVDTHAPSLGTLFGTGPSNDAATVVLSAIALSVQTVDAATGSVLVLSPNGTANSLASYDTASVTMTGYWTGISKAFASTSSDCTVPTGGPGTVTSTTITIQDVPIGSEVFFCMTADGKTLLSQNLLGYAPVTVNPGPSVDFAAGGSVNVEFAGLITYTGGDFADFNYATTDPAYPSFIRIVNNSTVVEPVFAMVQADNGSRGQAMVESGLLPDQNDLVAVSTIVANAGVVATTGRVSITLFAPEVTGGNGLCANDSPAAECSVLFSELMLNPGGSVVQMSR